VICGNERERERSARTSIAGKCAQKCAKENAIRKGEGERNHPCARRRTGGKREREREESNGEVEKRDKGREEGKR